MVGAGREKSRLLSSDQYDDDAPDVDSSSHGHQHDDDESLDGRTLRESAEYDHEVFDDDYEEENATTRADPSRKGIRGALYNKVGDELGTKQTQSRRSDRKPKRRKRNDGESEMVYEMEEGGRRTSSNEDERKSIDSAEEDLKLLGDTKAHKASRRKRRWALYAAVVVLFLFFIWAAYGATSSTRSSGTAQLLSNGTALFAPTTILISLDGFRADFLQRSLTPTLNEFILTGISPQWMLPSFPSVTFPNHYTMATGLYPEAHGIVGNTFWDPEMEAEFYYTNNSIAQQPKWWGGEPFWLTAEKQGARAAVHMWPGSEAHIGGIEPSNVDKFNGSEDLGVKVDKILRYLDLAGHEVEGFADLDPAAQRPQLIAAYVPVVDSDGHAFGPNSTQVNETISKVDNMLTLLFNHIQERNLSDIVNVIIVSDHGMATTDVSRLLQLEDLVDPTKIAHVDGWPLYGLRPKDPNDLESLHQQLLDSTKDNPNVEVYLRDKNMPARYHFSNNPRIAPLWIVPKAGWAIVTKEEFDIQEALKTGAVYHPRGLHGYDHEHPLMRAIFVAHGPAFPHKPGSRMEVFQNTEVYNILCDSIGIEPAPNNGTLRLPLKPTGLHTDPGVIKPEVPADPPTHSLTSATLPLASPTAAVNASANSTLAFASTTLSWGGAPTETSMPDEEDGTKSRIGKVWQWMKDKANGIKDWVKGVFGGKNKDPPESTASAPAPSR